jgi:hypothetical protein
MNAATSVTALFVSAPPRRLAVRKDGPGRGTVASMPAGIKCGSDCGGRFPEGSVVTLTASAAPGSVFGSWRGCPTSVGASCVVAMSVARTVTVTFRRLGP